MVTLSVINYNEELLHVQGGSSGQTLGLVDFDLVVPLFAQFC